MTHAKVQWVPGGHSWMLARPAGQADVLRHLTSGMAFIVRMEERAAHLGAERASPGSPSPGATVPPLELIG